MYVAALRLLLLTGCRKSEILMLKWSNYRDGNLSLRDSKTGPRTVWLCTSARAVLEDLPRSSGHVFPVATCVRPGAGWTGSGSRSVWKQNLTMFVCMI